MEASNVHQGAHCDSAIRPPCDNFIYRGKLETDEIILTLNSSKCRYCGYCKIHRIVN